MRPLCTHPPSFKNLYYISARQGGSMSLTLHFATFTPTAFMACSHLARAHHAVTHQTMSNAQADLCFMGRNDEFSGSDTENQGVFAFLCSCQTLGLTWSPLQSITSGYIHCPAEHVTVLMLKNALVNINRPGWQDKFTFMPEEKTSISLTQKLCLYCSGGHPLPSLKESVLIVCVSFSLGPVFLASRDSSQWQTLSTSSRLASWPPHVGHCYAHGLCVKYHGLSRTALLRARRPAVWPMEKAAIGVLIVKASQLWFWMFLACYLQIFIAKPDAFQFRGYISLLGGSWLHVLPWKSTQVLHPSEGLLGLVVVRPIVFGETGVLWCQSPSSHTVSMFNQRLATRWCS